MLLVYSVFSSSENMQTIETEDYLAKREEILIVQGYEAFPLA